MAPTRPTYYRRVLPSVCVAFASEKGKQLFKDALSTGYMDCYFSLASQFRTQEEPAYCGLSSLVMVLNALAIDPGVVWKGVFRWYHEDMLDCCTPLEEVQKKGVSMDNLMCLAICNQLDGELKRVTESSSIAEFREDVKHATTSENKALIASYGRGILGQTGSGHFSPIGGYNHMEDMVLVLDVARFKYPPYWVPLTELWKAMKTLDKETGRYRGYMMLWRADEGNMPSQPPLLFKVSRRLNISNPIMEASGGFLLKMRLFLLQETKEQSEKEILKSIFTTFLNESYEQAQTDETKQLSSFLSLRITTSQLVAQVPEQLEVVEQLIQAINETELCKKILNIFPDGVCCRQALFSTEEVDKKDTNIEKSDECSICFPHFLTIFLLSFPVDDVTCCGGKCGKTAKQKAEIPNKETEGTYSDFLKKLIDSELGKNTCTICRDEDTDSVADQRRSLLVNEVTQLKRQLVALLNLNKSQ